jgi:alkenylglycerophosphocholine hydrolase
MYNLGRFTKTTTKRDNNMIFLYLSILFGAMHWVFIWQENRTGILITKPAMMVSLILWEIVYENAFLLAQCPASQRMIWFLIGIIFCTIGDVFLMFRETHFLKGLVAFLLGHVFYVIGFGTIIPIGASPLFAIGVAALIILSGIIIFKKLHAGMVDNDNTKMLIPVALYTLVISAMLYSAIMTHPVWRSRFTLFLSVGALLFYISDVINAWVQFVGPVKRHRFKIMTTYYIAELFIAIGATMHFLTR